MKPRCPYCNAQGLKHLSINHVGFFAVIFCGQCGAIYGVVPTPAKQQARQESPPQEAEPSPPQQNSQDIEIKHLDLIAEIGEIDLSKKVPYSSDNIFAYMQAARINPSTQYRKIAYDEGPPLCSVHKLEMEKLTIPKGFKNSGRVFWVCPDETCRDWLLAE